MLQGFSGENLVSLVRMVGESFILSNSSNQEPEGLFIWLLIPFSREGNGTPLQYSCLENPVDGGAWWAVVHGVTRSWIRLSNFTFTFHFHALEEEMATHSSVLAWRIPGAGAPGGLPSLGSHRVGHDWSDLAAAVFLYLDFLNCWNAYPRTFNFNHVDK